MTQRDELLIKRLMHIDYLLTIGVEVIKTAALPSLAAEATLKGVFALPGLIEKVTAELVVRETGLLTRELLIAFTDKTTGQPITHFDGELTQGLHVLAINSDFSSFLHEHAVKRGLDKRLNVAMCFPKPGTYYVYADAVLMSLGQQVIRFDVSVHITSELAVPQQAHAAAAKCSDGPYTVRLDASDLRVGTKRMIALTILQDGKPAIGLGFYFGVPAYAVFVSTNDLGYVRAHVFAADAPQGRHTLNETHDDLKTTISAGLMLHATPSRAGRYAIGIRSTEAAKCELWHSRSHFCSTATLNNSMLELCSWLRNYPMSSGRERCSDIAPIQIS